MIGLILAMLLAMLLLKLQGRARLRVSGTTEKGKAKARAASSDHATGADDWALGRKLWTASSALGFVTSAAALSDEMDVPAGVAWVAAAANHEEACEIWDLFEADRDEEHANDLTLLFAHTGPSPPAWAQDASLIAVPGRAQGKLCTRKMWMLTAGTAPPYLASRRAELVIRSPPPTLDRYLCD